MAPAYPYEGFDQGSLLPGGAGPMITPMSRPDPDTTAAESATHRALRAERALTAITSARDIDARCRRDRHLAASPSEIATLRATRRRQQG